MNSNAKYLQRIARIQNIVSVFRLRRSKPVSLVAGDEDPELLFIKEVKRRGMNTSSLLEGSSQEEDIGISKTNLVSTEIEDSLSNQRERSMALNSEGIEVNSSSRF